MKYFLPAAAVALILPSIHATQAQQPATAKAVELAVAADYPGGSAKVELLDQQGRLVRILPGSHPDRGWVCWWYFKLTGIELGETITLDVGGGVWATPDRASFSLDNQTWTHTAPGKREGQRIVYRQTVEAREAWFAWGPPFVPADAARLVEQSAKASPHAQAFELCRTREDRSVPALRVSAPGAPEADKRGIWIQARQHAWESGASWVCQGLTEWLVSDDDRAETLRQQALVTIVPIMDIDNVAIGAGGKQEKPQDHNRDWSDEPHWKSVAAAQREIARLNAAGQFDLFVDLHNPGPGDRNPYYYVAPRESLSELGRRNLDEYVACTRLEMTGPLTYLGKTLESGAGYDKAWQQISKNWVTRNTGEHVVALTLETAWNTPHSTQDNYRRVGRELGLAIERYFRTAKRGESK